MAKTRRTEAFYRELVGAYRRSGMTQRAFAAKRGVPAGTLSAWAHRLAKREAEQAERSRSKTTTKTTPTKKKSKRKARSSPAAKPALLPVRVVKDAPQPSTSSPYEVVLTRGLLRLPADFDPARVGALLRAAGVSC